MIYQYALLCSGHELGDQHIVLSVSVNH